VSVRRREFITLLGGAAAWPLAARAQQRKMKRVALLVEGGENDAESQLRLKLFRNELQKLGWTERNLQIDVERTGADPQRMRTVAAETIRRAPDVIVTGSNQVTTIVGQQTRTIPIIFTGAGDPVGTGLVANMAHPGGNVTGFTTYESEIAGKRLELLKQVVPTLTHVAALYTPEGAGSLAQLRVTETVPRSLNLSIVAIGRDQVRAGDQPCDREDAGHSNSPPARARRRCDRIKSAALHMASPSCAWPGAGRNGGCRRHIGRRHERMSSENGPTLPEPDL
jgi:putative tryptophan/tyrosine transport system substrate-binding protein